MKAYHSPKNIAPQQQIGEQFLLVGCGGLAAP